MTEPTELLPCPFCGGSVELESTTSYYDSLHGERQWWGVVCRNTTSRGGSCAIQQRPSASKDAAIDRWNRRTASPAVAGEPVAWRIDALELEVRQLTERTAALQKPYEKGKHMTPEQHAAAIEDAVEFYLNASIGMLHFVERVDLREFAKTARQELQAAIIAGVGAAAMTPTRTR